ncbi:MAG TPA: transcription antitermination factor NusB [Candidatus Dormibacteraeota bacterium]|nr:transcription antitermination factor NusB [Candidatus Dormibacteraeota bacterium]
MTPEGGVTAGGRRHSRGQAGRRRRGRELALRVLFELEGTERDAGTSLRYHAADLGAAPDVADFAGRLVTGTLEHAAAVDSAIDGASVNWRLRDIGKVERAILRLGAYELLFEPGVPVAAAIDEAIELTRTYAGDEASPFVNGVLGRIARGDEGGGEE